MESPNEITISIPFELSIPVKTILCLETLMVVDLDVYVLFFVFVFTRIIIVFTKAAEWLFHKGYSIKDNYDKIIRDGYTCINKVSLYIDFTLYLALLAKVYLCLCYINGQERCIKITKWYFLSIEIC
ncbi:MAG: hypothetical protein ACE5IH_03965 [Thermodesulfobacteriota bacterium]